MHAVAAQGDENVVCFKRMDISMSLNLKALSSSRLWAMRAGAVPVVSSPVATPNRNTSIRENGLSAGRAQSTHCHASCDLPHRRTVNTGAHTEQTVKCHMAPNTQVLSPTAGAPSPELTIRTHTHSLSPAHPPHSYPRCVSHIEGMIEGVAPAPCWGSA